jgi:hypothetical protein
LAERLQQTALDLQEQLIEAAQSGDALNRLRSADVTMTKLRTYLRLCHDLELLSDGQYAHAARMTTEVGRLLGGWIKSVSENARS